jgi:mannose-1-phosphate guanylyltransferase
MAGGTGSRLWPLSRALHPKQFLSLTGEDSMLQETLHRLSGLEHAAPYVLCNQEHRFLAAEQLAQMEGESARIMLEPEGRNMAPPIALAALDATKDGADPLLLVLAADHLVTELSAFHASIDHALALAEQGHLVTFGVVPTHPETEYGYIQRSMPLADHGYAIREFVEKPDRAAARTYLDSGDYYWNSGMFVFRAGLYLEELGRHQPDMLAACQAAVAGATVDLDFCRIDAEAFAQCPANSIDYAVLESTDKAAVVPLDAGWSDIGSWSALWRVSAKDDDGNALRGDVLTENCKNTLVRADSRLVATLGIDDLVVVESKDAVLVARKDQAHRVNTFVTALKNQDREEHSLHREVYRPWGKYDSVDTGNRHKVKRITVNPGAKLSVQMHHHRAEHWVVVSGMAQVTNGERTYMVAENESTYIPAGQVHALENPGVIPLELIEVQSGSYLGEYDIVRFEDKYGRC